MNRFKFEGGTRNEKRMIDRAAGDPLALGNLFQKRVVDLAGAFLRRDMVWGPPRT